MKRNIISALLLCGCVGWAQAQITEFDAMTAAKTDLNGTARYMGMAGAFGALGGDVSAIKDNPAGLGIYRSSEVTATFGFRTQSTASNWNGSTDSDGRFKFTFDNVAAVTAFPTWAGRNGGSGLLQSNWSLSYNRLKSFNRRMRVGANGLGSSMTDYLAGFTNGLTPYDLTFVNNETEYYDPFESADIPWLSTMAYETFLINNISGTDPATGATVDTDQWASALFEGETVNSNYYLEESGGISEFAVSWGGNISNVVYLGATLNFQNVNYRMTSRYIEDFGMGTELGEGFTLDNNIRTSGLGINGNFGIIVRPVDFLRIGLAYKTPMRYNLTTTNYGEMYSTMLTDGSVRIAEGEGSLKDYNSSPAAENEYEYEIHVPGKLTVSAAWIIGKKAIVSADFGYTNYRNLKMHDLDNAYYYDEYDDAIRETFSNAYEVNIGGEYRITDHVSARVGYALETATMKQSAIKIPQLNTARTDLEYFRNRGTNYITAGLGYRGNVWYIDAAFVYSDLHEDFIPYNTLDSDPATLHTRHYNVIATIGFRF